MLLILTIDICCQQFGYGWLLDTVSRFFSPQKEHKFAFTVAVLLDEAVDRVHDRAGEVAHDEVAVLGARAALAAVARRGAAHEHERAAFVAGGGTVADRRATNGGGAGNGYVSADEFAGALSAGAVYSSR